MLASQRNSGAFFRSFRLLGNQTATAAGAGDNTPVNTPFIDRMSSAFRFDSGKVIINYTATLSANQSISFGVTARDATDAAGTGAAIFETAVPLTVAVTSVPGGTVSDTFEIDVNHPHARKGLGFTITPDLSAGATDTVAWTAVYVAASGGVEPSGKAAATIGRI